MRSALPRRFYAGAAADGAEFSLASRTVSELCRRRPLRALEETMTKSFLRIAAFAAVLFPVGASAVNLTGTWVGSYTCTGYNGSTFKVRNPDSTLLILHEKASLSASLDGGEYLYNGAVIDDDFDPTARGELVINQCTTNSLPLEGGDGEIIRFSAKVNTVKGTGTLKGLGILESIVPNPGLITCKYKYKLLDQTPVKFPQCTL
jgi:hypothetical protein